MDIHSGVTDSNTRINTPLHLNAGSNKVESEPGAAVERKNWLEPIFKNEIKIQIKKQRSKAFPKR